MDRNAAGQGNVALSRAGSASPDAPRQARKSSRSAPPCSALSARVDRTCAPAGNPCRCPAWFRCRIVRPDRIPHRAGRSGDRCSSCSPRTLRSAASAVRYTRCVPKAPSRLRSSDGAAGPSARLRAARCQKKWDRTANAPVRRCPQVHRPGPRSAPRSHRAAEARAAPTAAILSARPSTPTRNRRRHPHPAPAGPCRSRQ